MQILNFLSLQIRYLRQGGPPVLLRKARTLFVVLAEFLLLTPSVLAVRLLRPLVVIRFGPLRSERIGHFAGNTELYLCERDTDKSNTRTFDFFYHGGPICNQQLKKCGTASCTSHGRRARWIGSTESYREARGM